MKQSKRKQTGEYIRTYIPALVAWYVRCVIPVTAILCSKESTTQHGTAPHHRAKYGIAPHDAALLSYTR